MMFVPGQVVQFRRLPLMLLMAALVGSLLVSGWLISGCAARTSLEPVGKGELRGNASLGGPLVYAFDTYVPIPAVSGGASYGLDDRLDLTGTVHILSLAYGIVGIEPGMAWYPVANEGGTPTIAIHPRLLMLASFKGGVDERVRVYPLLSSSAAWRLGDGLLYTGFDMAIPFSSQDYDQDAAAVIFSPLLGYRWNLGGSVRLYTELKWHGANIRSDQLAAEYVHPWGNGALAPFVGVDWGF